MVPAKTKGLLLDGVFDFHKCFLDVFYCDRLRRRRLYIVHVHIINLLSIILESSIRRAVNIMRVLPELGSWEKQEREYLENLGQRDSISIFHPHHQKYFPFVRFPAYAASVVN